MIKMIGNHPIASLMAIIAMFFAGAAASGPFWRSTVHIPPDRSVERAYAIVDNDTELTPRNQGEPVVAKFTCKAPAGWKPQSCMFDIMGAAQEWAAANGVEIGREAYTISVVYQEPAK